jgi:uncharacterized protein YgbK (DUF1537 family)
MGKRSQILLAFYGDDFTGSTDALESIASYGAKAILFLEPPTTKQLEKYPNIEVFGVAGKTRSLPTANMEPELIAAFESIKSQQPLFVHYKVCSTFDSSEKIGSIGKAIDCGIQVFEPTIVPVIGGAPGLGRYCVFGNLFASFGIGTNGKIFRLDRHPSMGNHPVTPSLESDLKILLAQQTTCPVGLLDVLQLALPIETWMEELDNEKVVLLDTLTHQHLEAIGKWLSYIKQTAAPVFVVGGSSVETALGMWWSSTHALQASTAWPTLTPANKLLVVSGSCSPITANQIKYALEHGFAEIIVDTNAHDLDYYFDAVEKALLVHDKLIVHSGTQKSKQMDAAIMGTMLGQIAKHAITVCGLQRIIIAGGDTSSYAARSLEIEAVEMVTTVIKGAPLCLIHSSNVSMNGVEVNFKGGQVGPENYFSLF